MVISSAVLKTEGLAWLRYTKRLPIVCTEVGQWNCDILGMDENISIEIEVKVSKADLRAEFRNKKAKHHVYKTASEEGGRKAHTPSYFYYLVPEALAEDAIAIVGEEAPKAGIAVFCPNKGWSQPGKRIEVRKKPQRLHDDKPSAAFLKVATARLSSEMCHLYIAHETLMNEFNNLVENVRKTASEFAKKLVEGAEDAPDNDISENQ